MINQPLPHDILSQFTGSHRDKKPVTLLLVAFSGWNDAGQAASDTLGLLDHRLGSRPLEGFSSERFFDYTAQRPIFEAQPDGSGHLTWPQITFSEVSREDPDLRLLMAIGPEPSLHWKDFVQSFLAFARKEEVDLIVLLGSLLDEIPHTRPVPLSITSMNPDLLRCSGVQKVTYQGPTGLIGVLAHQAEEQGIPAISLWASIPHYIGHPPQPRAVMALMSTLETMLDIPLPVDHLAEEILAWDRGTLELLEDEPELANYVKQLENTLDEAQALSQVESVDIAAEFEKFLKRRGRF